jgi:acyl-CoA dehydrogenase
MNFDLSEDEKGIQATARKFAREVVRPKAAHLDETSTFPKDIIKTGWELGLLNMTISPELGGVGLSHLAQAVVAEELAWGCAGVATSMIANDLALLPIILGGSKEQHERFVKPFTEKFLLTSFGLTEPGAGSDVAGMRCTARREGDFYVLNGQKQWITNGEYADQFSIFCTTDPAKKHKGIMCLVVQGRPKGLTVGKHENKMGQRASNTVTLTFEDVKVPVANRIGNEGDGFQIAMATLDNSRPLTAMFAVGIARAATEHAIEYAKGRQQAHPRSPGDSVHARRHGEGHPRRTAARLPERVDARRRPAQHAGLELRQVLRGRHRDARHHRRRAGLRRLRVHQGVPGREADARRQARADLRGHQPGPAARDGARAAEGLISRWLICMSTAQNAVRQRPT